MGALTDEQKLDEMQRGIIDWGDALASAAAMIEALRKAAHADQVVIQRLRRERDGLFQVAKNMEISTTRLVDQLDDECVKVEALKRERDADKADQVVIQRLRRERDKMWSGWDKSMIEEKAALAENQRLAALIGSVSEEAEMLRRDRDVAIAEVGHLVAIATEAQAKLAQSKQRAVSRGGKVPRG